MAVDLRLEIFAIDLFNALWVENGYDHKPERPVNYVLESPEIHERIPLVMKAVYRRRQIFLKSMHPTLYKDRNKYSKDGIDFYYYLYNNAKNFIAYDGLNIFDKLLMSCAVASEMYDIIHKESKLDIYTVPLSWAMYFEKTSIEEFYAEGGYTKLYKHVEAYNAKPLTSIDSKFGESGNDLIGIQELFQKQEVDYDFEQLYRKYKSIISVCTDKPCCPRHLPLSELLHVLCNPDDTGDNKQVEGYLQLLLRMLTEERLNAIEEVAKSSCPKSSRKRASFMKKVSLQIKSEKTSVFLGRIFNVEAINRLERDSNQIKCIFCIPEKKYDKVDHILSVVNRTVREEAFYRFGELSLVDIAKASGITVNLFKVTAKEALKAFITLGINPPYTVTEEELKARGYEVSETSAEEKLKARGSEVSETTAAEEELKALGSEVSETTAAEEELKALGSEVSETTVTEEELKARGSEVSETATEEELKARGSEVSETAAEEELKARGSEVSETATEEELKARGSEVSETATEEELKARGSEVSETTTAEEELKARGSEVSETATEKELKARGSEVSETTTAEEELKARGSEVTDSSMKLKIQDGSVVDPPKKKKKRKGSKKSKKT